VSISGFERTCVKSHVEGRESVTANLDPARSNASPGAEEVSNKCDAMQSSKFPAIGALVVGALC
jgi:hypothetical protein